jgi:hypothetical protein
VLNVRDVKNSSWRISRLKKPWMSKSKIKPTLTNFDLLFHIRGIIQSEFVPQGTTVNQTFYVEALY